MTNDHGTGRLPDIIAYLEQEKALRPKPAPTGDGGQHVHIHHHYAAPPPPPPPVSAATQMIPWLYFGAMLLVIVTGCVIVLVIVGVVLVVVLVAACLGIGLAAVCLGYLARSGGEGVAVKAMAEAQKAVATGGRRR